MSSPVQRAVPLWVVWMFLVSVLAAGGMGLSQAAEVRLERGMDRLSLAGRMAFLDDPEGRDTLAEIMAPARQAAFRPMSGNLGRGYSASTSWLRLDLHNATGEVQTPVLRLGPQMLDHVDVYVARSGLAASPRDFVRHALGDHVAPLSRAHPFPVMAVALALGPGERQRIYLRVRTTSSHLLDAELVSPGRFQQEAAHALMWVSAYQALALGFSLVTFLQALRLRDLTHGLYGLLPLGLAINSIGTEGMTPVLLPGLAHGVNDWVVGLSILLAFGGLSLFATKLFKTRLNHPWGHRYLSTVQILSLAAFLASGTEWYGRFMVPLMALGLFFWVFLSWAAWRMIRRGEVVVGRLFLLAFTLPLLGAAVGLLQYLGVLPHNDVTQYIVPVTSLIHMVLMMLALSERFLALEAGLREATRLARQERAHRREQEQLLAMIGHEIRTPVAVIDAATQTLEALDPSPSAEQAERYRRIRRSSHRLALLLDLVTARNAVETGADLMQRVPVSVAELTDQVLDMLDGDEARRCSVDMPDGVPEIHADPRLLRFAWLNLIDNACKYSPADSPVTLHIAPRREEQRDGVEWTIQDAGPGIPSGMASKIFKKYQRGGEYRNKPGLGLGLYLAQRILTLHGGTLTLVPTGRGACFRCWLPLAPAGKGIA